MSVLANLPLHQLQRDRGGFARLPWQTPATRLLRSIGPSSFAFPTRLRAAGTPTARREPERQPRKWKDLVAQERLNQLPLTDMRAGGYDHTDRKWLDRAFHPRQAVHPDEGQRRALRRMVAINRIVDIANGHNRARLKKAGVDVPTNESLLADFRPRPEPDGPQKGWVRMGNAQRAKWHVYGRLRRLGTQHGVPMMQHTDAYDLFIKRGGQLQGYEHDVPTFGMMHQHQRRAVPARY